MVTKNQEKELIIGKTKVGGKNPCFIVAEIGINFNGKYENAINLIDAAAKAGCNAVKFQLFKAKKMYTEKAGDYFRTNSKKENIFRLVKKAELPENWIPKLKKHANSNGLEFFSTACDEESADVLEKNNISAYKIASYEITHVPLLKHIAKKGKPIIFSSAGATIKEIKDALKILKEEKNNEIVLMHCIGKYPTPLKDLNLNVIDDLRKRFPEVIIGYSDHSL
ncbi:N-acetylneuraminate synthase family protein, partial [Patescibacteria group bacterium]|nr:N-acetylneuraminate synthase family protein [Patescibacteria group bacterium]